MRMMATSDVLKTTAAALRAVFLKPFLNSSSGSAQTKVAINQPGDRYEEEADQPLDAAARAFFEPRFAHNFSRISPINSRISPSALTVGLANDPSEREADEFAGNVLRISSLPLSTQAGGADFSRIRIHTDALAADSSRAVNALAYTVGNPIVFGAGNYSTTTIAGKRLLDSSRAVNALAYTVGNHIVPKK